MTPSERWLTLLLRLVGTAAALAVVAVFMPRAWIDLAHQALGFGPFPEAPVAEYLARTTSLFYVLTGVVHWWLSLDVRRYGRVIVALGVTMLVAGMVLLWIDIRAGMPAWWTLLDGPFGVAMGAVYLVLQFRSRVEVYQAAAEDEAETDDAATEPSDEAADVEDRIGAPVPDESEPEPESNEGIAGRGWDDRRPVGDDEEFPPSV